MEKKKEGGSKMDFEKAKLDPAAVFKSPQEVVSSQELSREQKIEILCEKFHARMLLTFVEELWPEAVPQVIKEGIRFSRTLP